MTGSERQARGRQAYVNRRREVWATDKLLPVWGISYLIKSQKLLALLVTLLLGEHRHPFGVPALEKHLSGAPVSSGARSLVFSPAGRQQAKEDKQKSSLRGRDRGASMCTSLDQKPETKSLDLLPCPPPPPRTCIVWLLRAGDSSQHWQISEQQHPTEVPMKTEAFWGEPGI